ncbi:ABC transporter permease [Macrococcoides canis]|uniref:ABC transporter permease n=1 Tax=Macrococcoides canis TaxID=1855823 RepID=UPI00105BD78B|nr:ABC transporter permease [Macrococcus canis]TDM34382.1 ABC transporter permease [Macrococcus canis]
MNNMIKVLKEQLVNFNLIYKLSIYNMKSEYSNHYLGVFWNILQPLMQVGIYYLVFGLGLKGSHNDVVGVPFILHLVTGIFPWLFISQSINAGAMSIYSKLSLVTKMKFPSSALISISFTNSFLNLLITTSLVFVISVLKGYVPWWHYLWFIYFIISSYLLIFGINLIMSTVIIIIRDFRNILQNVIRMGFFLTPIFWAAETADPIMSKIMSFNPFAYLIGIYRTAFIHGNVSIYGDWKDHLYFWTLTLLLLFIGSQVHYKFKNKLVDYL